MIFGIFVGFCLGTITAVWYIAYKAIVAARKEPDSAGFYFFDDHLSVSDWVAVELKRHPETNIYINRAVGNSLAPEGTKYVAFATGLAAIKPRG